MNAKEIMDEFLDKAETTAQLAVQIAKSRAEVKQIIIDEDVPVEIGLAGGVISLWIGDELSLIFRRGRDGVQDFAQRLVDESRRGM